MRTDDAVGVTADDAVGVRTGDADLGRLLTVQRLLRDQLLERDLGLTDRARLGVCEALLHLDQPHRVLRIGACAALDLMDGQRADAGLYPPGAPVYSPQVDVRVPGESSASFVGTRWDQTDPLMLRLRQARRAVVIDRVATSEGLGAWRRRFLSMQTTAMAIHPLFWRGRALGMVCIDRTTDRQEWDPIAVAAAERFTGAALAPLLFHALDLTTKPQEGARLTPSELAVARLAALGWGDQRIAGELGKSRRTVENQLRAARAKLGVNNRTALARAVAGIA